MSWTNIYISGRPGFEAEVTHQLERSGFDFLPGYTAGEDGLSMYWINEKAKLRDFKKAIGAKTIFDFRLHFFSSAEAFRDSENKKSLLRLTPREEAMIREMHEWEEEHDHDHPLRHSA